MVNTRTVVFDLDGTIYQDTAFYHDYISYLVEGTAYQAWGPRLDAFAAGVFAGQGLVMNSFYRSQRVAAQDPDEYFAALTAQRCTPRTYEDALVQEGIVYLGDAWAVVTYLGTTLGLMDDGRGDALYRRMRCKMEQDGMTGSPRLKQAISRLAGRCDVIMMSNSYEATVLEFLRQLGFEGLFPCICASANKPHGMIGALVARRPDVFARAETVVSIGDHAFNDLMPVARMGGRTVWINPYPQVAKAACDVELASLDELADYLDGLS